MTRMAVPPNWSARNFRVAGLVWGCMVSLGAIITAATATIPVAGFLRHCRPHSRLEVLKPVRRAVYSSIVPTLFVLVAVCIAPVLAHAKQLNVPPEVKQGLDRIFDGDPDAAIDLAKLVQQKQPEHPVGYLLEAEARWWKIYCEALEVKYGMADAWKRSKRPGDEEYLALADRGISLAQAQLKISDSAEMHLYAGMGLALKAKLFGLREERRATAHAGVDAREQFLHATQLDPDLADAYTGLGLYNYYADALSGIAKVLRFFMGIPGGSKKEGIQQLEIGMSRGELIAPEARYYYARNLRTYDQKYEEALAIAAPLVERYPHNPIFLLMAGNLNAELGRREKAATSFRAAEQLSVHDPACAERVRKVAETFLSAPH
jgi:tetratricopeptide (TPR) repeat protein